MPTTDEACGTEEETDGGTRSRVLRLRQEFEAFEINRKPDPGLKRDLKAGFLLPYVLEADALIFGRWDYWLEAMVHGRIPDRPVPSIDWMASGHARTRKMLETALRGPEARKLAEHGRMGILPVPVALDALGPRASGIR